MMHAMGWVVATLLLFALFVMGAVVPWLTQQILQVMG